MISEMSAPKTGKSGYQVSPPGDGVSRGREADVAKTALLARAG
ncbi:hypothetical protein [Amycolatopsis pigmentata]|uniref:Uncharacterized protein n=1 Tax=Amycolatopsis pigmentata TaxID=450801 RepID=A0ABW5G376_9PSEU